MPSFKKDIPVPGLDSEEILNLAYGTISGLGWRPKFAADNILLAYTPRSWNKNEIEIFIETANEQLIISSKMIQNEMFDITGRNKKNISEFENAFEQLKNTTPERKPEWDLAIEELKKQTAVQAQAESAEAQEMGNLITSFNTYLTYGIIGANVLVFLLMLFNGADIMNPDNAILIKWGANIKAYTLNGEWWRLATCMFLHIGIIHLLFNMYALLIAGSYLEPILGKIKFLIAYTCSGVFASIASLWWHHDNIVSAGASGAIFGMYGVFLALLVTKVIPASIRKQLLQSIVIFVGFNLLYGTKSGIDNAAHIGGLLSGFLFGYLFYLEISKKISLSKSTTTWIIAAITIAGTWMFLKNYSDDMTRKNVLLNEFSTEEEKAIEPLRQSNNLTSEEFKKRLQETSLPSWKRNAEIINEMGKLAIPERLMEFYTVLKSYTELRLKETDLLIKAQSGQSGIYDDELEKVNKELTEVLTKLNEINN